MGPKRAEKLAAEGFHTVRDLLWALPNGYEVLGPIRSPSEIEDEGRFRVAGTLQKIRHRRRRGRGGLVEAVLTDAAGTLDVVWFQHGSLADRLRREPTVVLYGSVRRRGERLQLNHPEVFTVEAAPPEASARPRYRPLGGLSPRQVADLVDQSVAIWVAEAPEDDLDPQWRRELALPGWVEALRAIHRPAPGIDVEAWNARCCPPFRRLAFVELLAHQRELARAYWAHRRRRKKRRYRVDDRIREVAREVLPFRLTGAQRRVLGEMARELQADMPMLRLLQGDVGSGKTIVAALLMLLAAENGHQAALLAPTELLAEQHAASLYRLFGDRYPLDLRTSKQSADTAEAERALLVVGTHALLEDRVSLPRLALAIIDEQHRFGVHQRRVMAEKGSDIDLLVMSATPIPRTLALCGYGDLDLSVLDQLPPGRQPVETLVVAKARRKEVYRRLRDELGRGAQGYVVFPAIRESDQPGLVSLEGMAPKVEAGLPGVTSARFHGQLPWEERREIMDRFRRGEVQLLLATTVVEVGVDVPTATAMIIEGAERFGLAQLHQLRGRVGRGERAAWCAAVHGPLTREGALRLEAFATCSDGFAVAERDLAIRGPGELLGERQAGMIDFRVADLERHADLLEVAQKIAREEAEREWRRGLAAEGARETTIDGEVRWFGS